MKIDRQKDLWVIECTQAEYASPETENALLEVGSQCAAAGARGLAVDLAPCASGHPNLARLLARLSRAVKAQGLQLFGVGASKACHSFLKSQGLDSALTILDSLVQVRRLLDPSSSALPRLNVEFVNPFIEGTLETLKVQCQLEATAGKPYLKAGTLPYSVDIAGVIGVTSRAFNGSIAICFPEKLFLGAMSQMLGEKFEVLNKDLEDGAGELLNIIFGFAKTKLNEKNFALEKAIPTVVRGSRIEIKHILPSPTVIVPFTTPLGPFHIEVGLEPIQSV